MPYTPLVFDAAPAQPVPAKDSALARIRERIHSGEFQPGVKLSIDTLATEPAVSRTPVRDAFGQLARGGLVTITSRAGVFVRRLTRSRRRTSTGRRTRSDSDGALGRRAALSGPACRNRGQIWTQTTLPVGFGHAPHCLLRLSTSIRPRPRSDSGPASRRAGMPVLPSHTRMTTLSRSATQFQAAR
jgi:hypothetical protein